MKDPKKKDSQNQERAKQPAAKRAKKKVLIIDDHPIVCKGIAQLIDNTDDLMVSGEALDGFSAFQKIEAEKPDVVISDITLKESNGIEIVKRLKIEYPNIPVLIVSMHEESLYAERALRAGARGYVMKQEVSDHILDAIRQILSGDIFVSDRVRSRILQKVVSGKSASETSPIDLLSDRELEVFQLIGQGLSTRKIADRLHLSVKTIESYRAHIKEKLNLTDASEMVQHAIQWTRAQS